MDRTLKKTPLAIAIMLATSMPAFAQQTPQTDSQDIERQATEQQAMPDDDEIENIVVNFTGTSIRGVAPAGSAVIGIEAEQLLDRGATTVTEAIRQVPQIFNLGTADTQFSPANNANANRSGGTGINLRGLNPEATLVVFNNRRVPSAGGGNSTYFDPSVIPGLALERVEVMADGGSAIYGADAVGGVVNILSRRKFDGAIVSARYGSGDDISQTIFSGIVGKEWETGSAWIAVELNDRDNLAASDRDFFTDNMTPWGGPDLRLRNSNPGTILANGTTYAIPMGQDGTALTPGDLVPGTANLTSRYLGTDALPSQDRMTSAWRIQQELSDTITISFDGFAARRESTRNAERINATLNVPSTNPWFVHPTDPTATSVSIDYTLSEELGMGYRNATVDSYYGNLAIDAYLGGGWNVAAFASYGKNEEDAKFGTYNRPTMNAVLADSNPATAFNPFADGAVNDPAMLSRLTAAYVLPSYTEQKDYGITFDGPLMELPAGDIRMAIGAEYLDLEITSGLIRNDNTPTNDQLSENITSIGRTAESVFSEVFVPLTDMTNDLGALTLSIAGRYDNYSDFGSTFNPKYGLTLETEQGITWRASYGSSYRAPAPSDLNDALPTIQLRQFADSSSPTGQSQVIWLRGPNGDLGPEEADIYSFGADFEPASLPGLTASVTYFNIKYENRIETPGNNTSILNLRDSLGAFIDEPPSIERVQSYLNHPAYGDAAVDPASVVAIIDGRRVNTGTVELSGLDLMAFYNFSTDLGDWQIGGSATHLLKFDRTLFTGAATQDILDTINNPLSWQGRGQVSFNGYNGFSADLFINYAGGYDNNTVAPVASVGAYVTSDLALKYEFLGNDWRDGLSVSLDVKNLTDKQPPYVQNGTMAFDPQVADMVGRYFIVGVRKAF